MAKLHIRQGNYREPEFQVHAFQTPTSETQQSFKLSLPASQLAVLLVSSRT